MFRFFLRRYFVKLAALRGLFIFSLIPALIYLVAAASQPDRFSIYQKIKIAPDAPLALSGSPSEFASTDWFLKHQDDLFLDAYTLQILNRELQKEFSPQSPIPADAELIHSVKNSMSLLYKDAMLRITYNGTDQTLGEFLAAFYAKKVMKKAEDGIKRQKMLLGQMEGQVTPVPAVQPYFELKGGLTIESDRALWRGERLPLTLLLLAAGLAAVLIWIGILELLDTSFKSERQVARLLRLPVLGIVPDLNRVSRIMNVKV